MNRFRKRGIFLNVIFSLILLSLSYILIQCDLDRKISAFFYSAEGGWRFTNKEPWNWMHRYGHIPGVLFAVFSLLFYIASFFRANIARYRRYFLVVLLTTGIGGGVLINIILKDNWGRPRPHQVEEFGGYWEYRDMNAPGITGKGRSFSCGHCAMGYIFLTTVFFYETSKTVAVLGGVTGLIFGVFMSLARVGQGGHFTGDALWSLGIILITGNTLYNLMLFPSESEPPDKENERKREKSVALFGFSILGVAGLFSLFLSPVYDEYTKSLQLPPEVKELRLKLNFNHYTLTLLKPGGTGPALSVFLSARGSPSVNIAHKFKQTNKEKTVCVEYSLEADGHLVSEEINVMVKLPANVVFHEVKTGTCRQE